MARTTKRGTCELCGASANVGMNHGSKVCPQCTHVQSALNKRIESVAAAARSMGKTEELLGHLIPAGGGIAVKMTADFLQEISGIVGYDGEDPAELVAAVRRRVLTCASCEAEDVLAEIRQVIGYVPEQGDGGLADAVRQLVAWPSVECGKCTTLRVDLLRACGLEMEDTEDGDGWDTATAAAVQTIGELTNRRDDLLAMLTKERADNARLYEEKINRANAAFLHTVGELKDEIVRLNNQTQSEPEQVTRLRDELTRTGAEVVELRDKLQAAQSDFCLQGELLTAMDNDQVVLADFARRVLRGEVAVQFLGVRP